MATEKGCFKLIFKKAVNSSQKDPKDASKQIQVTTLTDELTLVFGESTRKNEESSSNAEVKPQHSITLSSLYVDKMIGTHNTIVIECKMTIQGVDGQPNPYPFSSIVSYFKGLYVTLKSAEGIKKETVAGKEVTTLVNPFFEVDQYVVVEVRPVLTGKVSSNGLTSYNYSLTITAASWDILLDKTERSRAFTAKRLGGDILTDRIKFLNEKFGNQVSADSFYFKTVLSGMRSLQVSAKKKSASLDEPYELKLPYLVQYNETDYMFLLRNANRYGEFLYFENGVLNLGLTKILDANNQEKVKRVTNCSEIEALSEDKNKYDASLSFRNAIVSTDGDGVSPFIAEYSNDDFFDTFKKGAYDSKDGWIGTNPEPWSRNLAQFFRYENIGKTAIDMALAEANLHGNSATFSKSFNDNFDGKYFKTIPADKTSQYDKDTNPDNMAEFTDFYGAANSDNISIPATSKPTSSRIWNLMREEYNRSLDQYELRFGSTQMDLQLGDVVKVDDIDSSKEFVVVKIHCEASHGKAFTNSMCVTVIAKSGTEGTEYAKLPVPLPANVDVVRNAGAQPAVVVDSMDPKRIGRVRVKYHWQSGSNRKNWSNNQADTSDATPWIRVAVPFTADESTGFFSKLNPGDEVMVDYENGNIERPYVVGSLYDSAMQPPFQDRLYSQILRSRNGQMIGFKEPANAMNILSSFIPGLKMFGYIPGFNTSSGLDVKNDRKTQRAMGGIDITDYYGLYSISTSSDQRSISINSPFGTVGINAAMGITVSAPNGNVKIVGKNVDIVAGNNLTLKSGTNIENALLSQSSGAGAKKVAEGIANALVGVAASFFDLPALRFAVELFIKPITGTLKIHSGRYLLMEAGEGSANVPKKNNYWLGKRAEMGKGDDYVRWDNLVEQVVSDLSKFRSYLLSYRAGYIQKYNALQQKRSALSNDLANTQNRKEGLTLDQILEKFVYGNNPTEINNDNVKEFIIKEANREGMNCQGWLDALNEFKAQYNTFVQNNIFPLPDCDRGGVDLPSNHQLKQNYGSFKDEAKKIAKYFSDNQVEDNLKKFVLVSDVNGQGLLTDQPLDKIFKTWAKDYIIQLGFNVGVQLDNNMDNWDAFVTGLSDNNQQAFWDKLGHQGFGMQALDNLVPWDFLNVYTWRDGSQGRIIMSQDKGQSIQFEGGNVCVTYPGLNDLMNELRNLPH